MSELKLEKHLIPTADLGDESPLPSFRAPESDDSSSHFELLSEDDRKYMGWCTGARVLPHKMQDSYNREKREREHDVVVLENDLLRATFMPSLGGKLFSLIDKRTSTEVLHRNPVIQPANFAIRNAWTSGGIEWNCGQVGHHYYTCSTVFSAKVNGPCGEPVFRIYEWDRVKGVSWQVDFYLPDDSPFLFWRVRIVNPHSYEIPMYWWTNIAVNEHPETRIIVDADKAIAHLYTGKLGYASIPSENGADTTYPERAPFSRDFFYKIREGLETPWIAAIQKNGRGFFQISTEKLIGRKLFVWGACSGGRRFQEYLAQPGEAYAEIQAGLGKTQMENVPMPAQTEWTWVEACGPITVDPEIAHSSDWQSVKELVGDTITTGVSAERLKEVDSLLAPITNSPCSEMITTGEGWGELERERKSSAGKIDRIPKELDLHVADPSEGVRLWRTFLETGLLPETDPVEEPSAFIVQPEWRNMLEDSMVRGNNLHWAAFYHLGNMRMEAFDADGARKAWEESIRLRPSAWAERNLAVLDNKNDNEAGRIEHMKAAYELAPAKWHIVVEYANALVDNKAWDEVQSLLESAPSEVRAHEKLRIPQAKLAIERGELDLAQSLILQEFADVREGDGSLAGLWNAIYEERLSRELGRPIDRDLRLRVREEHPVPSLIDFRMAEEQI